jgi:hypothetical protein
MKIAIAGAGYGGLSKPLKTLLLIYHRILKKVTNKFKEAMNLNTRFADSNSTEFYFLTKKWMRQYAKTRSVKKIKLTPFGIG